MNELYLWTVSFMPVGNEVDLDLSKDGIRLHGITSFEVCAKNVAEAAEKATRKLSSIVPYGFCLLRAELTNYSKPESTT